MIKDFKNFPPEITPDEFKVIKAVRNATDRGHSVEIQKVKTGFKVIELVKSVTNIS